MAVRTFFYDTNGGPMPWPSSQAGWSSASPRLGRWSCKPKVLLLDEPLSQLDTALRVEMRDLIAQVQREVGVTTLFVTHDQHEAVSVADGSL